MDACPYSLDVSAYHDGELPSEKRTRLEAHLQTGCPACNAELRQWHSLSSLIAASPMPVFTAAARQKLYELSRTAEEMGLVRIALWATAMAACVLIVVAAWMATTQNPSQQVAESQATGYVVHPTESTDLTNEAPTKPRFDDWVVSNVAVSGKND